MHFSLYNIHQAALNSVWEKEQEAVAMQEESVVYVVCVSARMN